MPMLPWPVCPLAGHARLGQNTVVGSMTILLSWLCWGACQEEVCLDPRCPVQPHSTTVSCGATSGGIARYNWKSLLSGYAPAYAYDLGRLDTSLSFADLKQ